jgi:hypothetical protein
VLVHNSIVLYFHAHFAILNEDRLPNTLLKNFHAKCELSMIVEVILVFGMHKLQGK